MFKTDYKRILATQSSTGDTEAMMEEINRQLDLIGNLTKETDDYGNLYVTKGKATMYPAFVCHTDTVHKIYKSFTVCETELNHIYAYSEDDGFQQVGIGGDDKSGIIACLELLTRLKIVKCVFFLDEEQGCKGSSAGRLEFFDNCRYAVQIDRKGSSDIITRGSGTDLCSKEFEELLDTLGSKYGYKSTTGFTTDVVKLKDRGLKISACNLSAGYHNPHTKQEYIDANQLLNCIDFCLAIAKIKTVYEHTKPIYTPSTSKPPLYNLNTTKYSDTSRRCAVCNERLGYNFGIICNECVVNSLTLTVDETTATVTQTAFGLCENCEGGLYTEEEVNAKYCYACQYCSECSAYLETEIELSMEKCEKCLVASEEPMTCSNVYCNTMLVDSTERLTGYCNKCIRVSLEDECMSVGCRKELVTITEIDTGMCYTCMQKYG